MEILVFFMFVSLCSFGILMVMELCDEAIAVGSGLLLLGLLVTITVELTDKSNSREGNVEQNTNAVITPYSPVIQDVEVSMSEPMAVVAQIARAEQGEMNYVLRENIGMPAISYHRSSNPPLTEEALPVTTPTKPLDTPNTEINNSEHSFYGFEFSRVLNTVLVLFAIAIIALGFMVFSLRNNLERLAIRASHRAQHCEALVNHLENQISVLEHSLAMSQMNSRPSAGDLGESSRRSLHDVASSALKMHRKLKLD